MDIAEVVRKIEKEYALAMKYDKKIADLYDKVSAGAATYAEASKIAEMSGQHIGNILASNLAESFPNGITTEDAMQLVPPPLRENHEYVAAVAEQAQKTMNEKAGVGLKPVVPEFDEKRAEDLAEKIADGLSGKQIINECINESRHTVDNSMRVNARAHEQVGMKVRVTREYDGVGLSAGRECTWCLERCGRDMTYSEAYENGTFERHPGCGCEITYTSAKGITTRQSKAGGYWEEVNDKKTEQRKKYDTGSDYSQRVKEADRKARIIETQARVYENDITRTLLETSRETEGTLRGLEHRFKGHERIKEKLIDEPDKKVRDALRYTFEVQEKNYAVGYQAIIENLEEKGYHISEVKNSWIDTFNPYNGINTNIISNGGYEFEIQFHTEDSLAAREKMHRLYEQQRKLSDPYSEEYIVLSDEMFEIAKEVRIPEGVESLK